MYHLVQIYWHTFKLCLISSTQIMWCLGPVNFQSADQDNVNTYIYLAKNIVIGQMFTDVKKKTQKKFDVTILTQVVIGILDLWNAVVSQNITPLKIKYYVSRKSMQ
jgi:hypothetical protein